MTPNNLSAVNQRLAQVQTLLSLAASPAQEPPTPPPDFQAALKATYDDALNLALEVEELRKVCNERGKANLLYLQTDIHNTAVRSGWWETPKWYADLLQTLEKGKVALPPEVAQQVAKAAKRNVGEAIALMHSELSEGLEADRAGNPPDDKVPEFSGLEAELADTVIRILDLAAGNNLRVVHAIYAKAERNKTRSYKHGGKAY
jgi:hypothetical protein